jgi:hypothetical protein
MNRCGLLGGFLVIVGLAILLGVWRQRSQLASLRTEQRQLLDHMAARADDSASPVTTEATASNSGTPSPALVATPELLRLRNEVTRLTERRRELAGAQAENERLRAQLANRSTNGPGGFQLPPGYLRKGEARMVGYNTPDDTLQSLLWALQNHDVTNLVQAFAPEIAQQLRAQAGESRESIEDFFSQAAGFVGMRILKREPDANEDSIAVEIEMVPGEPARRTTFRQVNGQWKITGGF